MYGIDRYITNPGLGGAAVSAFGGMKRGPDQRFDYFFVDGHTETTPVKLAAGQILKARTWLQRNAAGEAEAYGAFETAYALTIDGTWVSGETAVIAGITLTLTADATDEEIVAAFAAYSDLQKAGQSASIGTTPETSIGIWTGTWTGSWTFAVDENSLDDSATASRLIVSSTVPLTQVTALATPTETAASGTIAVALKSSAGEAILAFSGTNLPNAGTVTIGGVVFTAGASTATPAQIVAAFVAGSVAGGSGVGALSGTNAGFTFSAATGSNLLKVSANSSNTTPTLLNVQTSATTAQLNIMQAPVTNKKVIGMLVYDINANSAAAWTSMFTEAHVYFEGCKWENTPGLPATTPAVGQEDTYEGVDYVVNGDGTVSQCSAYYTGINDYSSALQFIENSAGGTEFKITSWELTPGEKRNEW